MHYPQQRVYFGIAKSNRLRFSLEETWRLRSFAIISKRHKSSWNAIEEEFRDSAKKLGLISSIRDFLDGAGDPAILVRIEDLGDDEANDED